MRPCWQLALVAGIAVAGGSTGLASAQSVAVTGAGDGGRSVARTVVGFEYNPDLATGDKRRAAERMVALLAELGIGVETSPESVLAVCRASGGRIAAEPLRNAHRLYEALNYLSDVVRLPAALHPLFHRIVLVQKLRAANPRSDRMQEAAIAVESAGGAIVVNHENLNQLESFGNFVHPKINFAMLLQVALEARLVGFGGAALESLGLDVVVDDLEWARLNGSEGGGWSAYTGEDLAFVGVETVLRVSPPGILFDTIRELQTGVPSDAFAGMPDARPPWLSPRHGPQADRQGILRSLFSRDPLFFDRLGGGHGIKVDGVLREKTRLILYAALVGSGGVLDHGYWRRRHPSNPVIDELSRDFDPRFLTILQERIDRDPATRGIRLSLP